MGGRARAHLLELLRRGVTGQELEHVEDLVDEDLAEEDRCS